MLLTNISFTIMAINLEPGWLCALEPEFEKEYMQKLKLFLKQEQQAGNTVYPKNADIFNAFNLTPFNKVKVVIIGQDPYHGANQAHGLAFSVNKGVAIPPSLQNIYKELQTDIAAFKLPTHGNLTTWAHQGVLLLNSTLTVRANMAGSHQKKGWEQFTDAAIKQISSKRQGIVFLLWGKFAQAKQLLIQNNNHCILKAAHPSPLSAYNGFFFCKHFSKTNDFLSELGREPIDWQIT